MPNSSELEANLSITFFDKSLLQRALTHRSYLNENPDSPLEDNERLEYLGDAVLDFITAEHLYHRFPEMDEGQLTSIRAALVREETLARFADSLYLGVYLQLGKGEEAAGGRERSPILCAAFEALIGALWLDQGLEPTKAFLRPLIEPAVEQILREELDKDPKSRLQELTQGQWQLTPRYRTVGERGPDHAKVFTVEVVVGGDVLGRGEGRSKQLAEQEAARTALQHWSQ